MVGRPDLPRLLPLCLLVTLLLSVTGCEGCRQPTAELPKSDSAPLNEFLFAPGKALPAGDQPLQTAIKPGHWFTASQSLRSNLADQRGTLYQQLSMPTGQSSQDSTADSQHLAPHQQRLVPLTSQRQAILPRGSSRRLDGQLLAGIPAGDTRNAQLSSRFQSSLTGVAADAGDTPLTLMAPHESLFVVLTSRPNRFTAWQSADWARTQQGVSDNDDLLATLPSNYFRLILPPSNGVLPLPESALYWTSTAVLLWDDLPPEALTEDQARALQDWVRFGGRLIINGSGIDSRALQGPLKELLPLSIDRQLELDADAVAQLLNHWSVAGDNTTPQQIALAAQRSGRVMAGGTLMPQAEFLPHTAELVARKQVGQGAVVITRFDLTSDWMSSWRSGNSFINAAILGRPPRRVVSDSQQWKQSFVGQATDSWADRSAGGLRLLSRDAPLDSSPAAEYTPDAIMGFAGWTDTSDVAKRALGELVAQSGVDIPDRRFVIRSLGIYLLILVPLNYCVFRVMGRLEWAWVAVPLIGLGGAIWIARAASLDMGFARSQTEIAVVEMHAGYPRAHATRYLSLYNSLSSRYDLAFATPDAAAAPVGVLQPVSSVLPPAVLRYGDAKGPILADVEVASNRTRQFHAEQFVDAGGAISLSGDQLINDSLFELSGVQVVRRDLDGALSFAWLDELPGQSRQTLRWLQAAPANLWGDQAPCLTLLQPLVDPTRIPAGATRLVAYSPTLPPDLTIQPAAAQHTGRSVVVVHLQRPPLLTRSSGDENLPPTRLEFENDQRKRETP